MKLIRISLLLALAVWLSGCLKPYHFNEDWWKEKVKARDSDWGKEVKGE